MLYYEFNVGEDVYKLRLNTRAIISLEKKLKLNPVLIFMNKENQNIPTVEQMLTILEVALQEYHKDVDAYSVFDKWVESGHIVGEFTGVIVDLYRVCGLFKTEEEKEKN